MALAKNEKWLEDVVRHISISTNLPLSENRARAAAEILKAWLPDANALSCKMASETYQNILPMTVFLHPDVRNEEV